ncbi:MAG TPA: SusC/RagA family TonB-linked outer membrane protein, partial [Membranihabitans sp.]|nr:SusC/RagA family TonB-linked outer membrane protein [Membranihabitans sp.]
EPLIGVNVLIKGTTRGTSTDFEGRFTLDEVDEQAVLVVSYIGYQTQEIKVGGRTMIEIVLIEDSQTLDEVVVVGYGTQKKSDLTGAVHRVDASDYENQSATSFVEMLNGTVAGFNSNQGTSASGGGSLEVRGPTSLKASNTPLIVLDGVIFNGSLDLINPNDIESIDILKDASAAAVFGARSAAGVVIVTTKKGNTVKPSINFTSKLGLAGITNHMRPQTPEEYLQSRGDYWTDVNPDKPDHYYTNPNDLPAGLSQEEWKNFDATPSDDVIQMWFDRMGMTAVELENYKAGKTVDWYDLVYRNGFRQDYDMSLSGSMENLNYYWSIGYTDNEGVQLGDHFQALRSRINLDANVTDFLNVGINVQYADRDLSTQNANLDGAISASPYGNIYEPGSDILTFYPHEDNTSQNPLLYYQYRDKLNITQNLFATLTAKVQLPLGIEYRVSFANRYDWQKNHYFDPINTPNGFRVDGEGRRIDRSLYEWQIDNVLTWNQHIGENHEFNVTLLANAEKYQNWESTQNNTGFAPSGALSWHALQAGINPDLGNNDQYSTGNAFMARLNYSLLGKYMITATWRRDGYSAFGQRYPYATFPSTALAWRLSEETFFDVPWINYAKLRLSWGVNGNRAIGRYDALARLGTTKYLYGTTLATGVYNSTLANRNLKWERTEAINVGIDFGLYGSRISGSLEYYDMTTYDLLLNRSLPRIIGYTSVASNLGELKNKGFELTINTVNMTQNLFEWNSILVFSFNRNKIKHLYGEMIDVVDENGNVIGQEEADDIGNGWFIGQSLDRIWEYEILGVWQLDERDQAAEYGKQPGDIKLRDVNEDGVLSPTEDKVFQNYKRPQYKIGLRNEFTVFNNFQISAFLRADIGFYGVNNLHLNSGSNGDFERRNRMYRPYWRPDNPINDYARLNSDTNSPGFNYWEDRSFLRLQDLSLAYIVPSQMLTRAKIQHLKFFVSARNLMTVTGWGHYDPESQTNMMPKIFTAGINIVL